MEVNLDDGLQDRWKPGEAPSIHVSFSATEHYGPESMLMIQGLYGPEESRPGVVP